jgi:hypothetical protein
LLLGLSIQGGDGMRKTAERVNFFNISSLGVCLRRENAGFNSDAEVAEMLRREVLATGLLFPFILKNAFGQVNPPAATLKFLGQDRYFALPGKAEEVYQWRLHACDVLEKIDVPRGFVFRGPGGSAPDVVWQYEFPDRETARQLHRKVMAAPEFKPVMEHMGTLIRRFEGSLYQEVIPTSIDNKG